MDKQTLELIKKCRSISTENLLEICGYLSTIDYEEQSEQRFTRENLILDHVEDLEYHLENNL